MISSGGTPVPADDVLLADDLVLHGNVHADVRSDELHEILVARDHHHRIPRGRAPDRERPR